jgi:LDH2 family malate/lactate/ureidoglycolate dehydrogenase
VVGGASTTSDGGTTAVPADELEAFAARVLVAAGATGANAARVAEALVSSHLAGLDSHGVQHLPGYVRGIQLGHIVPTAEPVVAAEDESYALVRGNWTFGHVSAAFATRLAIEKAARRKIAMVGLVEATHIGRLGEYAEMAATADQIAILVSGGLGVEQPAAVPYGGREPVLHTNPIAMGFPAGGWPMILDFATTATAGSKVLMTLTKGEQMPPGYLVDRDGRTTTDPAALFHHGGAHLPFGGHKGSALMLAVELLGRVLSGADEYAEPGRGHQGVTIIAIDPSAFQPLDGFRGRTEAMLGRVRAVPPAPGFTEVLVPGDPEHRARQERRASGIPIPAATWRELTELAASLSVAVSA